MMKIRFHSGFTIIELVIVVAAIAILSAIALPSYFESIARSKRTDGKNALMDLAARQEKHRFGNNSFTTDLTLLGMLSTSSDGHYTLQIVSASATAFEARVTPTASQANDKCGVLTINQAGVKGTSNGHGRTAEDCWR